MQGDKNNFEQSTIRHNKNLFLFKPKISYII
jgi:hypothetical protein